jgi:NAD+ synthase (glutamine-hydrolysing)
MGPERLDSSVMQTGNPSTASLPSEQNAQRLSERASSADIPESAKVISRSLLTTGTPYRVAIAQISTEPGAITANTEKIIRYINDARDQGADLVVFPELAIPGYCSMDLLWNPRYIEANLAALEQIKKASMGLTVVVGFVDVDPSAMRSGGRPMLYNSAAIIHDGELLGTQDKALLPNYDIFFEDRYFAPSRGSHVWTIGSVTLGTEICEDLWSAGYQTDPTRELVNSGANLIVNLSASPFHIGKLPIRHQLLSSTAAAHKVPMIYANLVGGFDGFDGEVIFDGRSMIMNQKGQLSAIGRGFSEQLLISDIFAPQELELPPVEEVEELYQALVLGIKDYFTRVGNINKANFKRAFIGLSGGIDSAVVAALAVEALGAERVCGITLPSRYNSEETKGDAALLAQNLAISFKSVSIERAFSASLATLDEDTELAAMPVGASEENIQARLRMIYLMYYANRSQGLVLNTGNKTELALDNCTIYGDMVGGFSVLGDVDKDRVFALARFINHRAGREIIPWTTINRPPSAELKESQVDADVMGDDPQHIAPLVRGIIEGQLSFSDALNCFSEEYGKDLIQNVYRKLDRSEWKRRQASPGIRVTPRAFGVGRRMPMSHGYL